MQLNKDKISSLEKSEEAPPATTWGFLVFVFKAVIKKKKYWLLPFWILLLAIAITLFLTGNGALLPAIYLAF
jgi:hypothetical protein